MQRRELLEPPAVSSLGEKRLQHHLAAAADTCCLNCGQMISYITAERQLLVNGGEHQKPDIQAVPKSTGVEYINNCKQSMCLRATGGHKARVCCSAALEFFVAVLSRVRNFLPQMQQANAQLEQQLQVTTTTTSCYSSSSSWVRMSLQDLLQVLVTAAPDRCSMFITQGFWHRIKAQATIT